MKKITKYEAREHIVQTSKKLFLRDGYLKTSIRDIAKEGDLTLGRIYVYFKKKEDIFIAVIEPVLSVLKRMTLHQMSEELGVQAIKNVYSLERTINNLFSYACLIQQYRDELELLLFKSEGFDKINFREKIIVAFTQNARVMLNYLNAKGRISHSTISNSFLRSIGKLYVSMFEEIIINDPDNDELKRYINTFGNFVFHGMLGIFQMTGPKGGK